ncbi:hypothetical protein Bca52824_007472 [Brassica carinata]|uniref:Uncharacterized protein n=1 Tax=Brassica carinata TaxID=52824 RepID=A0A8X8B5E4_BRACI|nr:hypothetical protein Bca52824_007472 [Brassica carinata]
MNGMPVLVYMSKVDGKFNFSPISVIFLTQIAKVMFGILMLFIQLYVNPATVKMLSNLQVLVIAVLLKMVMKRWFSIIQWEALALLLIGISVNQLRSLPEGATPIGIPLATGAYICTILFVRFSSPAWYCPINGICLLKSQYDTSIYLQVRYNLEEIFIHSCYNIYRHSISSTIWTRYNHELPSWDFYRFDFNASVLVTPCQSETLATTEREPRIRQCKGYSQVSDSIVYIAVADDDSFINMAAGANEEATHRGGSEDRTPFLPR